MDDPVSGQELVTVPLSFGFAEESISELYRNAPLPQRLPQRLAATARRNGSPQRLAATPPQRLALKAVTPPSTRASCPMCKTRASTDVPDHLYNLKSVNMTLPAII